MGKKKSARAALWDQNIQLSLPTVTAALDQEDFIFKLLYLLSPSSRHATIKLMVRKPPMTNLLMCSLLLASKYFISLFCINYFICFHKKLNSQFCNTRDNPVTIN